MWTQSSAQRLVVLLLYAYCVGLPSSRKIEKACWEDAAFRVLTGNQKPDHSRISDFRRCHLGALAGLFVQVLKVCHKAGLVSLGHVALDGTKVKANASKHKAMSHERMRKSERQLERTKSGCRLTEGEMRALLRRAELIDAQEDGQYGKGKRGDELPEELHRRSSRLEWIRKAKAELEAEGAAAKSRQRQEQADVAEQEAAEAKANGDEPRSLPTQPATPGLPPRETTASRAFGYTDPDSHILKGGDGWIQGYNCQAAVDGDHQVIVAIGVSNQASDAVHLLPMLERIKANTGQEPEALIADAGYCSTANLEACEGKQLDAYISTNRQQHGHRPRPSRGRAPQDLDARDRMDRKLPSVSGQAIYALRKPVVEPVFG